MSEDQECCCCKYRREGMPWAGIIAVLISCWISMYMGKALIDYGASKISIVRVK
jgi:hypothetical protein